jgi:hypothetical protein
VVAPLPDKAKSTRSLGEPLLGLRAEVRIGVKMRNRPGRLRILTSRTQAHAQQWVLKSEDRFFGSKMRTG